MVYFVKLKHFKSRLFSIKMIEFKEYGSSFPMKMVLPSSKKGTQGIQSEALSTANFVSFVPLCVFFVKKTSL